MRQGRRERLWIFSLLRKAGEKLELRTFWLLKRSLLLKRIQGLCICTIGEKCSLKASQEVTTPCHLQVEGKKEEFYWKGISWEESTFMSPCEPGMPSQLCLCDPFYCGQLLRHPEASSVTVQGKKVLAKMAAGPWHCSHKACVDMQSYKAMAASTHISTEGPGVLAVCNGGWSPWKRLWRKQCVNLWRWRLSCNGDARNMESRPTKAADNEWRH